jgi:hypothetical protein
MVFDGYIGAPPTVTVSSAKLAWGIAIAAKAPIITAASLFRIPGISVSCECEPWGLFSLGPTQPSTGVPAEWFAARGEKGLFPFAVQVVDPFHSHVRTNLLAAVSGSPFQPVC